MSDGTLYWDGLKGGLTVFLNQNFELARAAVRNLDVTRITEKTAEEICDEIFAMYRVEAPVLDTENPSVEVKEEIVDKRLHPNYEYLDDDAPAMLRAYVARVRIEFVGEQKVMDYTPSNFLGLPVKGNIIRNAVERVLVLSDASHSTLDAAVDEYLKNLLYYAESAKRDCDAHNEELRRALPSLISERRTRVESDIDGLKRSKYLRPPGPSE